MGLRIPKTIWRTLTKFTKTKQTIINKHSFHSFQTRVWTGSLCACFLDRWYETQGTPPSAGAFSQAELPDDGLIDEDVDAITGKSPTGDDPLRSRENFPNNVNSCLPVCLFRHEFSLTDSNAFYRSLSLYYFLFRQTIRRKFIIWI